MSMQASVDAFIGDVKTILDEHGSNDAGLQRIADRMATFVREPEVLANHVDVNGNIHTGRQSTPLYTDESGLTLVRARFGPEGMTPIHNHGTWGIVGVYQGRDQYQVWRRLDSGDGEGHAQVEMVEERVLETGDVAIIPHPPQDIHAQMGHGGEPIYEFVLFGANAMIIPRLYFDPEAQTARLMELAKR
ncbi:MAG: hypothetical protein M9890_11320 [Thermomicrobiales bacterium]|nr:hypothetical protein [Thermomicrobiales bacterium]